MGLDISFDSKKHEYRLNGERVPSVTQILKAGGWIDDRFFTEEGRRRGEFIHQATALLDRKLLDWTKLPEELRGYVESYEKARDALKLRIRRIEYIVHRGRLWFGKEDREATWERQLTVVDLKSGAPAEPYDKLQLAGYGATHAKMPRLLLLYLKADGSMAKSVELFGERTEYYLAWYKIVSLYHWRNSK